MEANAATVATCADANIQANAGSAALATTYSGSLLLTGRHLKKTDISTDWFIVLVNS